MPSDPILARRELEENWRQCLEGSHARYKAATREYKRLLQQEPAGAPPIVDSPLANARQAQSEALAEYSNMLRAFADLTLHGKIPDESAEAASASNDQRRNKLAVVDDDESVRDATQALLRSAGYSVSTFASAEQFLNSGEIAETECLVLDIRMPGIDGLELQRRLIDAGAAVPIIFLTAHGDGNARRRAMDGGALDFLLKPFGGNTLLSAVQTALTRHR